jgi:hypothetical protein
MRRVARDGHTVGRRVEDSVRRPMRGTSKTSGRLVPVGQVSPSQIAAATIAGWGKAATLAAEKNEAGNAQLAACTKAHDSH